MPPPVRRFALTAHVTASIGWLGAVVVFLALALVGLTSQDARTVRGAYLVMEPAAWSVLVPCALASLLSGIVMSLGTTWGLVRHYWVLLKLLITVAATIVLLIYMGTFKAMAAVAADPVADLALVRNPSPVLHAVLALLVLLAATVLGMYKPPGLTPYGRRQEAGRRAGVQRSPSRDAEKTRVPGLSSRHDADDGASLGAAVGTTGTQRWMYVSGLIAIILVVAFIAFHLAGGGFAGHGP